MRLQERVAGEGPWSAMTGNKWKELVGPELGGGFEVFRLPSCGTPLNITLQTTTMNMSKFNLKFRTTAFPVLQTSSTFSAWKTK